jgi:hypothetical protein
VSTPLDVSSIATLRFSIAACINVVKPSVLSSPNRMVTAGSHRGRNSLLYYMVGSGRLPTPSTVP